MFNLLDKYYRDTKDDCLGSLLGGFNPNLFIGSMSADPAAWNDWKISVKKITTNEFLTFDETLQAIKIFVVFHKETFGFNLVWLIDKLNLISVDDIMWSTIVKQAMKNGVP